MRKKLNIFFTHVFKEKRKRHLQEKLIAKICVNRL
jgi:hypothetical protein